MPTEPIGTTASRQRASFADPGDLERFHEMLGRFERGEIGADEWRAFRLVHGTYGQRQQDADSHMIRVKIPQGVLAADQLRALADVAERWSRGFGHVTTRQNVQLHFVRLHDAEPALRRLAEAGLTTREACGNSVRNVTACAYAGVARDEIFDVTPYAEALTRHFLRHPLSSSLPRKFKIAFEGCLEDHAATSIHDIGFRAGVERTGEVEQRGFSVAVGGGTATLPTSARLLLEFVPAGEILEVAEAVVRVFHRLGDRTHRERSRLKFLVREKGWEAWRAEFHQALAEVRCEGGIALPFEPEDPPVEEAPAVRRAAPRPGDVASRVRAGALRGPGILPVLRTASPRSEAAFESWKRTNVRPQKQAGFLHATVTVPLGDVTAAQFRALADLSLAHGDGTVRTTESQDLLLRWVPGEALRDLYEGISAAGLGLDGANGIADVVSCPGAESCRLAVTQSRGLARLLEEHLRSKPELVAEAPDLQLKVSGCPNGCSRHHVAGIGFQGSARKLGERSVPQYFVLVGGDARDGEARFGRIAAKVPARRVPQALDRLIALYVAGRLPGETATAFFGRLELAEAKRALQDLARLGPDETRAEDYVDLGEEQAFRPETTEGECAA